MVKVIQFHKKDTNALTNDLTGKIAVVWRNTCQFGGKILNAQSRSHWSYHNKQRTGSN